MYQEKLIQAGLTKNEALAYLALLKLGKARAGEIVAGAKISSGKVYETLQKLRDKGLVKLVMESGVKVFIPADPATLVTYIHERKQELEKQEKEFETFVLELREMINTKEAPETVSILKGSRGISTLIYKSLDEGHNIQVMGVRSSKDQKFNNFWRKWHKARVHQKKQCKLLFSDKKTAYWRFFKKLSYTKVREVASFTPSATLIIDNNVFIFSYGEDFTCIHIASNDVAKSYRAMFESLWEASGKKT